MDHYSLKNLKRLLVIWVILSFLNLMGQAYLLVSGKR